jgi:hypothetical protein
MRGSYSLAAGGSSRQDHGSQAVPDVFVDGYKSLIRYLHAGQQVVVVVIIIGNFVGCSEAFF